MPLLLWSCRMSLLRGHFFECHSAPPASSASANLWLWQDVSLGHLPQLLPQDTEGLWAVETRKQGQL